MSMQQARRQMPARAGRAGEAHGEAGCEPASDEASCPRHDTGNTGSALLQTAISYEQIGETSHALDACRQVLKNTPDDRDALTLFGYLCYEDYPEDEKEGFRRDVTRRTLALPAISVSDK